MSSVCYYWAQEPSCSAIGLSQAASFLELVPCVRIFMSFSAFPMPPVLSSVPSSLFLALFLAFFLALFPVILLSLRFVPPLLFLVLSAFQLLSSLESLA